MKADNLFRFVSIRPPTAKKKIGLLTGDDKTVTEIDDLLKDKLEGDNLQPGEARLAVGHDLIMSNHYFAAEEWSAGLVACAVQAQALLQEVEQALNLESFQDKALELLAPVNRAGRQLKWFLDSDKYLNFKQSLWRSYYATILNPYERPRDREIITTWLLLLHLLESETEEEFRSRVQRLRHTRPALPSIFLAKAPPSKDATHPQERPEDPTQKKVAEIRERIIQLDLARRALNNLFIEKLQSSGEIRVKEDTAVPISRPETAGPAVTGSGISVDMLEGPWSITAEDLQQHAEHFHTARAAGILPEVSTLPEIVNNLDSEIASFTAKAAMLGERKELRMVGGSFVYVRRPAAF